jgi:dTDP-4-amino-4,6-dideoxygalactose transaminase
MTEPLALLGGRPAIGRALAPYRSYGTEEAEAAARVVESGTLSSFLGAEGDLFLGGPRVREFEAAWSEWFEVPHSVSVNSATSGLIAAFGALGLEPGDEVIVTPWTMAATATAIVVWNAIPVFADIEATTFGLDPDAVEALVTPRTRAIAVTDIFGHPARLDPLIETARRHGLKVVEDAAQAPGALYRGRRAGTVADIGVYSLNYHKHIHTGEGGMCVTRDPDLAERMQLIRNHAEAVAAGRRPSDLTNLVGFNFRMGEVEAAMGTEQLKKLDRLAADRTRIGRRLDEQLGGLPGVTPPRVEDECTHVYYIYGLTLDPEALGVPRARIAEALRAEGVSALTDGYVNVHRLPMYVQRVAYGRGGYPFSAFPDAPRTYGAGACPVAERLHDEELLGLVVCTLQLDDEDLQAVVGAFHKVWDGIDALRP